MRIAILERLVDGRPHELRQLGHERIVEKMSIAGDGYVPALGIIGHSLRRLCDRHDRVFARAMDPIGSAARVSVPAGAC